MTHVVVARIPTTSPSRAAGSSPAGANWAAVRAFGTKVASLGGLPGFFGAVLGLLEALRRVTRTPRA